MATEEKKALAKTAAPGALAMPFDYGTEAGSGWEGTSNEDFAIPFLSILQSGSPQVKKKGAEYVEGAEEGMLYNTATGELYDGDTGVQIIPCYTEHIFIEWKNKQTDGGGFVGVHSIDSDVVAQARAASKEFGKYTVPVEGGNPHDLVETFVFYAIQLDAAGEIVGPCMISCSSTKIKAYKAIMTPLRQVKGRPPLFAFKLRVATVPEKNAKGDFFNFKITPANGSPVESLIDPATDLFTVAKEFKDQVVQGKAKIDHSKANAGGSAGGDPPDVPF
jgi:hypothetical protein